MEIKYLVPQNIYKLMKTTNWCQRITILGKYKNYNIT
jgi:hypothetical protein